MLALRGGVAVQVMLCVVLALYICNVMRSATQHRYQEVVNKSMSDVVP